MFKAPARSSPERQKNPFVQPLAAALQAKVFRSSQLATLGFSSSAACPVAPPSPEACIILPSPWLVISGAQARRSLDDGHFPLCDIAQINQENTRNLTVARGRLRLVPRWSHVTNQAFLCGRPPKEKHDKKSAAVPPP